MDIIEFFSGLGSQAKALENIGVDYRLLNTCEWNINSFVAYDYIHNNANILDEVNVLSRFELLDRLSNYTLSIDGKQPLNLTYLNRLSDDGLRRILSAIIKTKNLVDITQVHGNDLPDHIDLLTYSFPCQDLSNAGSIHGFRAGIDRDAGSRSGLLWEVERILNERIEENLELPKFLLLENVTALDSKRHRDNFIEWQTNLANMGYVNKVYKLNAKDFGLPQNRKRIIMLSVKVENVEQQNIVNNYFNTHDLNDITYVNTLNIDVTTVADCLRMDYNNPTYLSEALHSQPNDTPSRRNMWENNLQIVDENNNITVDAVATITTRQDRHPNAGNIYFNRDNDRGNFRLLTPRECFLFMGFTEEDYNDVINNNFPIGVNRTFFTRDNLRKMAGNSIAVKMLEEVFNQVVEIEELLR